MTDLPNTQTSVPTTPKKSRKWLYIGGVLLLLIIIGAIAGGNDKDATGRETKDDDVEAAANTEATNTEATEAVSTEEATAPVVPGGIGISRAQMQAEVPGVTFEKGTDVHGQDNYVGSVETIMIQMIGPAENLTNVSATASLDLTSQEQIKNNVAVILGFCRAVNKDAEPWVLEQMTGLDPKKLPLDESKNMAGPNPHLQILPIDENVGMLTLTFDEE